jgi:hypothetical protein
LQNRKNGYLAIGGKFLLAFSLVIPMGARAVRRESEDIIKAISSAVLGFLSLSQTLEEPFGVLAPFFFLGRITLRNAKNCEMVCNNRRLIFVDFGHYRVIIKCQRWVAAVF